MEWGLKKVRKKRNYIELNGHRIEIFVRNFGDENWIFLRFENVKDYVIIEWIFAGLLYFASLSIPDWNSYSLPATM